MRVAAVGIVGQVAGEKNEIRLPRRFVEQRHRTLERLGAERIGRSLETDVSIAELREGEACGRFAIGLFEITVHFAGFGSALEERREFIEYADPDRGPGDSKKRPSVHLILSIF